MKNFIIVIFVAGISSCINDIDNSMLNSYDFVMNYTSMTHKENVYLNRCKMEKRKNMLISGYCKENHRIMPEVILNIMENYYAKKYSKSKYKTGKVPFLEFENIKQGEIYYYIEPNYLSNNKACIYKNDISQKIIGFYIIGMISEPVKCQEMEYKYLINKLVYESDIL